MALLGEAPPAHHAFSDLPDLLQAGDLLIRNTTKVLPARLHARREGGGANEILLVRELTPLTWECMAKGSSRLKAGRTLTLAEGRMNAVVEEQLGRGFLRLRFTPAPGEEFWSLIHEVGALPLPPYIERGENGPSQDDLERYQTVFANEGGAVAAPTAGLHFTPALFESLSAKGIETADLVLHVGPGTFRPVQAEELDDHEMDVEHYTIPPATADAVEEAKRDGRRIIAVGTTSTRALESAASEDGKLQAGSGRTDLFIRPPYRFKVIDGLITNFHLPRSTLLMLVASLCGRERLLEAYACAVREGYRFYSYGDATLVLP
jgi:S-adenosylmethionine:tRNA ribosyltransferase-isomerase